MYNKRVLAQHSRAMRGVVVNTRVANACTGEEGLRNSAAFSKMAEEQLALAPGTMFNLSTGVIGNQVSARAASFFLAAPPH